MKRALSVLALGLVALSAFAQDLQGADAALREVAKRLQSAKPGQTGADLPARIEAYGWGRDLSPQAAAEGWLRLYDAYAAQGNVGFGSLVAALPAPEAWNAVAKGLNARAAGKKDATALGAAFFAATLRSDVAAQWQALAALNKRPGVASATLTASTALAHATGNAAKIAASVERLLALPDPEEGMNPYGTSIEIPDLVALVGPKEAERILLKALRAKGAIATVEGAATRALVQRLALAHVAEAKVPSWTLVDEKTLKLYEALRAKFGTARANGPGSEPAARYAYALGLLKAGRRSEAIKVARTLREGESGYLGAGDHSGLEDRRLGTREFTAFLGEVARDNPRSALWDLYAVSAARSRELPAYIASLERTLAAPKLDASSSARLRSLLWSADFAVGRIDEGLARLRRSILAPSVPNEGPTKTVEAIQYARIGLLTDRPKVVEEGLALARKADASGAGNEYGGFSAADGGLVDLLLDLKRPVEAEAAAIEAYARSAGSQRGVYARMGGSPNDALVQLATLYYRLGRPQDVRVLLDRAPDWGVRDALELTTKRPYYSSDVGTPVGFVAAWALAQTGEREKAALILDRVLANHGGYDPAYALLVELKGPNAIPQLDALYAADQFEERPLIWKAVLQKDAGRLEEAEATVRKAIAVDPSDGETHGGHRLYAYAVLADVKQARGDAAGAAETREAVAAIRLAEEADELLEAGLLEAALAKYEASTQRFADAYCIQSRLAVQLMSQGREKEAEEHYRRAYELMPSSFGRVETHCMGCEGVFEGEMAQNMAERVFAALAKKTPENPQVHYLLGTLRQNQERHAEALAEFRKAVALDPEYLNAWKALAALGPALPAAERRTVAAAILRLDPLRKHGAVDFGGDPAARWRAAAQALAATGAAGPAEAYPLAASAARAERLAEATETFPQGWSESSEGIETPGTAVAQDPVVAAAIQLMDAARHVSRNGMEVE